MAWGFHLFPFRTQKLSPSTPMVLGWRRPGRVGRCRILLPRLCKQAGLFLYLRPLLSFQLHHPRHSGVAGDEMLQVNGSLHILIEKADHLPGI